MIAMLKIVGLTLGVALGVMIIRQLPDLRRYMKIRAM
jgi:small basic protein